MEKIVEQGLLYDFYGELLTEHQKAIYEDVVFNDLSLSEIAKEKGISRQGVHDMIKRCDRILNGYWDSSGSSLRPGNWWRRLTPSPVNSLRRRTRRLLSRSDVSPTIF